MGRLGELAAARFGMATEVAEDIPAADTIAGLLGHRTFRKYSDREVPDAVLDLLLAAAVSAPAKSDLQQYSIINVVDPEKRATLAELSATSFMGTAPIVLVFCGDIRRVMRIAGIRGHEYGQNTLDSFMNAAVDTALVMQNFTVAAEAMGLGCCYVSQVRKKLDAVSEVLGLPDGVYPICGLTAGYPDEERDMVLRLPTSITVHRDKYDDSNLEAELAAYDERRNKARPTPPDRQLHRDVYGVSDDYGWSENTARRLSLPDGGESLTAYLKARGFDLE